MIRCRQCSSELIEQARFCNVCGLLQNPQEPKPENSIRNREKALETNRSNYLNTVNKREAKVPEKVSIRPKTIRRPSFVPSRPTNYDVKSSTTIQQASTRVPESLKSQVYATQIEQPIQKQMQEKAVSVVQPRNSVSLQNDDKADISIQMTEELSTPTRAPGLIRSVTPNSSNRSVIPTRSDSNGPAISSPQSTQISRTPEYPISSSPTKVASPINNQAQPSFIQPTSESNYKPQIAQLETEQIQAYSQPTVNAKGLQNRLQEPIANAQTTPVQPLWQNSSIYDSNRLATRSTAIEYVNRTNAVSDTSTKDLLNPASFMATSKAAEQWRKSWRDRQYSESGPAENVSRGQASVPMPLTPMHQSFERMRTIQKSDKKQQSKRSVKLGTWITIFLMICLIIGLGAYIIISYIPNSPIGVTPVARAPKRTQATLVLVGTTSQTITIGQSIHLHGEQFGPNQTIIFLRDTAIPIADKNGNKISTHTDNQGAFEVTISIDRNWLAGSHSIEALDKSSSQNAFQTIQVLPAGTAAINSTELSVSRQGKPASLLTFTAVIGQGNPDPQQITITNTSNSPLNWTATAIANNNLNWLMINDNNNYGRLAISQPHSILISVNTVGLKITDTNHPYVGRIIFTSNNSQLLTLPVQLQIVNAKPEMVFSPNPIIAPIGPGNTCQAGVTLTLINLGTAAISWAVNPDLTDKIKFVSNGQPLESGTLLPSGSLLPSGQPGDTVVLTLQCTNIQRGQSYHVSVYANKLSWSELVTIQ